MVQLAKIFIFFLFFSTGIGTLSAQNIAFKKLFEKEDGLKERNILDVHRDNAGRFWLFYNSGIQRFDGNEFQSIKVPSEINLSQIKKTTSLLTGQIAIEFYDRNSFILFDPTYERFEKLPAFSPQQIQNTYYVEQNELYRIQVQHDSVYRQLRVSHTAFENRHFIGLLNEANNITQVNALGNSSYLLLDSGSLVHCLESNCTPVLDNVRELIGQVNQKLWIRKENNLIYSVNEQGEIRQLFNVQFNRVIIRTDKKDQTLVALADNEFKTNKLVLYSRQAETPYKEVLKIDHAILSFYADDYRQQLLVATHHGLWMYRLNDLFKNYLVDETNNQGLGSIIRSPFYRKVDSSIYVVKEQRGLYRITDEQPTMILPNERHPDVYTHNMKVRYEALTDRLYGIRYDLDKKSRLTTYDFASQNYSEISLSFDPYEMKIMDTELWLVGGKQLEKGVFLRLDAQTKKTLYRKEINHRIVDFSIQKNHIYFASSNGLYCYELNAYNEIYERIKYSILEGEYLNCLKLHNDLLLIGTRSNGLFVLQNDSITHHVAVKQGLLNNTIASIQIDDKDNIWLATFYGITVLDAHFNFKKNLTSLDGLPDDDFNTLASFKAKDGRMYFGTVNGLTTFFPNDLLHNSKSFSLIIDEVVYIKENKKTSIPVLESSVIQLPYGVDSFHVNYHTYDFISDPSHDDIINQITIESSRASDQLISHVNHVSAHVPKVGKRTITISQNKYSNGQIRPLASIVIETQSFASKFKYLITSTLLTLVLLFFLIKIQRQRRREKELFKEAEHRAELSRFQLQALQSQMNPHFIFNALGSIQYFIHQNEADIADGFLSDFASLMRLTLESSKSDMISLRDELKLLQLYVKLEHLRFEELFSYNFDIDDVDDEFSIPPMILQPFIENAINHGFPGLQKRKGQLNIKFSSPDDDTLTCIIHDNGIGRNAASLNIKKKHRSRGMEIVQERIKSIKLTGIMDVSINIEDIIEDESPLGTKVTVVFSY